MLTTGTTLPLWFQVLLGVIAILGFIGGAAFALFVIWPSIRRSNRVSDWLELDGKAFLKAFNEKTSMSGQSATRSDFEKELGGSL
jgi:uncharacterized membrane protein